MKQTGEEFLSIGHPTLVWKICPSMNMFPEFVIDQRYKAFYAKHRENDRLRSFVGTVLAWGCLRIGVTKQYDLLMKVAFANTSIEVLLNITTYIMQDRQGSNITISC